MSRGYHQRARNFEQEWLKLEKLGVPLEPPEYRVGCGECRGLLIEQAGSTSNVLQELQNGAVACIVDVVLVSDGPGKIIITARSLELPWSSTPVEWLSGVDSRGDEVSTYEFPGEKTLAYTSDVVINSRIDERGVLKRGDRIAGLLLGVSWEPIPEQIRHGCNVTVPLRIFDQFHRGYSAQITLCVWRSATVRRRKSLKKPRRSLFSECDYGAGVVR